MLNVIDEDIDEFFIVMVVDAIVDATADFASVKMIWIDELS